MNTVSPKWGVLLNMTAVNNVRSGKHRSSFVGFLKLFFEVRGITDLPCKHTV